MIGKRAIIFYNDTPDHVTRTEGILTSITETEYILDEKILIPKAKVVRVEVSK